MSVGQDTRYTYAVGRIRVLETRLLRREVFERMLGEKGPLLSLRLLSESPDYSKEISDLKDLSEFDVLVVRQLKNTHKIINELTKDPQITNLFLFKYDTHNIKVYLKTTFFRLVKFEPYIQLGILSPQGLIRLIKEAKFKELPYGVGDVVFDMIKSPNPFDIDLVLDRFLYKVSWKYIFKFNNPFLLRLYKLDTDLKNIKIALRLKVLENPRFKPEDFLENGYLDKRLFLATKEVSLEDFVSIFRRTQYYEFVRDAIKYLKETSSLIRLDRLSGDFIMDFLRGAKSFCFGIEPLIAYLLAKENEVRTIRAIIYGKLTGLSKDLIRERIGQTYI